MTVQYVDPFGPPWKFNWLRLVFTWYGGIFQSFWVERFFAVLVCTFAVLIAYFTTKDKEFEEWPDTRRFQAAIGMMLGFYSSTMYGRWSAVSNKEQEVMRTINSIALRIAWSITDEDESKDGTKDEAVAGLQKGRCRWTRGTRTVE